MLRTAHIRSVGKHLHRDAYGKMIRQCLSFQLATFDTAGAFRQQKRQAVFRLVDLFFQVEYRGGDAIIGSLHLRHGGFVCQTRIHQGARGVDGFLPRLLRTLRDRKLLVQHQQGVVDIGDTGNKLRPDRLPVVMALFEQRLRLLLGVAHAAENIQFPACRDGHGIGLRRLAPVEAAHRPLRGEGERRQERQAGGHQRGFGFLDAPLCGAEVGVALQALLDQHP